MIVKGVRIGVVPVYRHNRDEFYAKNKEKIKKKWEKLHHCYESYEEFLSVYGNKEVWEVDDIIGFISIITDGIDIEYKMFKKVKIPYISKKKFRDMMYPGHHISINKNEKEEFVKEEIIRQLVSFTKEDYGKNVYIKYDDFENVLKQLNLFKLCSDIKNNIF